MCNRCPHADKTAAGGAEHIGHRPHVARAPSFPPESRGACRAGPRRNSESHPKKGPKRAMMVGQCQKMHISGVGSMRGGDVRLLARHRGTAKAHPSARVSTTTPLFPWSPHRRGTGPVHIVAIAMRRWGGLRGGVWAGWRTSRRSPPLRSRMKAPPGSWTVCSGRALGVPRRKVLTRALVITRENRLSLRGT